MIHYAHLGMDMFGSGVRHLVHSATTFGLVKGIEKFNLLKLDSEAACFAGVASAVFYTVAPLIKQIAWNIPNKREQASGRYVSRLINLANKSIVVLGIIKMMGHPIEKLSLSTYCVTATVIGALDYLNYWIKLEKPPSIQRTSAATVIDPTNQLLKIIGEG